ncbi:MAG TPA: dihydropteroate synthase [Eudoraea sp.]|nr:dihydropteroate synthase [Eudoraea sp.]
MRFKLGIVDKNKHRPLQEFEMTINCKGKLIDLSSPKVMGIVNLTPDSFYDGGKLRNPAVVLRHTEKMLEEGATFIDVGAYSSRPAADHISQEEELRRIEPIITSLVGEFPDILLSIDTFRSSVARSCLEAGAAMINDISAGNLDDQMLSTVAEFKVPYILMHLKGTPQTMKDHASYDDLLGDILYYFSKKVSLARANGIRDLILDPGFGFSKTVAQNYEVLQKLEVFQTFDQPILCGLSRKSMISKKLNTTVGEALNGTTALNMYALTKGAHILRVHDVREAMECVTLFGALA